MSGRGFRPSGAGRARKRRLRSGVGRAGDGCEPEPERAGIAGGLRAGGHREVPDRLVGAEAGRAGGGPGRENQGPRSRATAGGPGFTCVSHTCAAPRDVLSPRLSPLAPPRVSPQPLPILLAAGLRPRASMLDSVPGCAWWLRQVLLSGSGTSAGPEKAEATPGFLQTLSQGWASERSGSPSGSRSFALEVSNKQIEFWVAGMLNVDLRIPLFPRRILLPVPDPWGDE